MTCDSFSFPYFFHLYVFISLIFLQGGLFPFLFIFKAALSSFFSFIFLCASWYHSGSWIMYVLSPPIFLGNWALYCVLRELGIRD
jgi:hypothetical protein